jgi:gas vesicle protein
MLTNGKGCAMKTMLFGVGVGALAGAAIVLAPAASASTADTVVNSLSAEGYTVQINQTPTAPLTACSVSNISKVADGAAPSAVVDIVCPDGC